ncbi:MAG: CHASE sensor domain-containing protein [Asticcacaulis sp.]
MSLLLLVGASVVLAFYAETQHDAQIRQSANVQAHILADSVSAALSFNDLAAIHQYTSALRANPDIEAVAVYDAEGELVAHYGPRSVPTRVEEAEKAAPVPATITVTAPVEESGVRLGTVYLNQHGEAFGTRSRATAGPACWWSWRR